MRVAALYDIHGNDAALEAVLAELEGLAVDLIVVGGDVAGGPFPCETVDAVRALGDRAITIRGNGERELVEARLQLDAGSARVEFADGLASPPSAAEANEFFERMATRRPTPRRASCSSRSSR